jgi:hypothetical protein
MSGDVWLTSTEPIELKIRSVSGDVNARGPRFDALSASTTSGDLRIVADLGDRPDHTISSVSGDVDITTASPLRVDTQTVTGDVRASGTRLAEGGRGRRSLVVGAQHRPVGADDVGRHPAARGRGHGRDGVGRVGRAGRPRRPEAPIAPPARRPAVPVAPDAPAALPPRCPRRRRSRSSPRPRRP